MTSDATHQGITILFVDDDPVLLRLIRRALHGSGLEILVSPSGEEALALMRERRLDVLISDIDMPGMSGIELIKEARREFPATVRMLLTGAGTTDRVIEAINEGEVHRFFTKPFDFDRFRATMSDLTDHIKRLRRDGELEARRARQNELYGWIENAFPGTFDVARDENGDILVYPRAEDLALLAGALPVEVDAEPRSFPRS